jgi:hypothetical protein
LIINFALEYVIGKVQDNQAGLKPQTGQMFLACVSDVHLFNTMKKKTEMRC